MPDDESIEMKEQLCSKCGIKLIEGENQFENVGDGTEDEKKVIITDHQNETSKRELEEIENDSPASNSSVEYFTYGEPT